MNQWIHKYLSEINAENFWEEEYIKKYNYLNNEDKVLNDDSKKYHKKFFRWFNIDIRKITKYIEKNKLLSNNIIEKLILGNICYNFSIKILKEKNILDEDNNQINNLKDYII